MRNKLTTLTFTCFYLGCVCALSAQFNGGVADGFSVYHHVTTNSIYHGKYHSGFDVSTFISPNSIYHGKFFDGFDVATSISENSIYHGEYFDGFASALLLSGGSIFRGEHADGYTSALYLYYHKWTGLVGTGWLVAGNWENDVIPTENIRAYIPADAPNMPGINAGTFKIGTSAGANYTCKALWIESGADLLCRINTFIENHSHIRVDGVFRWKNEAANSFINMPGATIEIGDGGVLRTEF